MREQGLFDPARLVFVDETAVSTSMARLRGRCESGERLIAHIPQSHWQTITFVAGLRHDGIVAPLVISGASFLAHLEQCLVPCSNPMVIIDSLIARSELAPWCAQAPHSPGYQVGARACGAHARPLRLDRSPFFSDCNDFPQCPSEDFLSPLNHLDSMEPILIRGVAYIVDGREPGEVRPRSLEISERPDR